MEKKLKLTRNGKLHFKAGGNHFVSCVTLKIFSVIRQKLLYEGFTKQCVITNEHRELFRLQTAFSTKGSPQHYTLPFFSGCTLFRLNL
jgi:hypothetical protein